jgi:hypothetical protein
MGGGGKFYVYEHWRLDREECFYVGKGSGRRAYDMSCRNRHHKAIQSKLNRIGFAMEVRIVASGLSEEEAFALEVERIKFWTEAGADLANRTYGGEGVKYPKSDEHKAKLAEATRNMSQKQRDKLAEIARNMPQEQRDKLAEKARNMSQEQRDKLREKARLQHKNMTPEQRAAKSEKGRINAMKRWSAAT